MELLKACQLVVTLVKYFIAFKWKPVEAESTVSNINLPLTKQ